MEIHAEGMGFHMEIHAAYLRVFFLYTFRDSILRGVRCSCIFLAPSTSLEEISMEKNSLMEEISMDYASASPIATAVVCTRDCGCLHPRLRWISCRRL